MNATSDVLGIAIEILSELKALVNSVDKLIQYIEQSQGKQEVKQVPAKTYTFEDVRAILAQKSIDGYREEAKALITKFGGSRLSDIKQEDYAEFIKQAEGIGNE